MPQVMGRLLATTPMDLTVAQPIWSSKIGEIEMIRDLGMIINYFLQYHYESRRLPCYQQGKQYYLPKEHVFWWAWNLCCKSNSALIKCGELTLLRVPSRVVQLFPI